MSGIDPRVLQWTVWMALLFGALVLGAWLISYLRREIIERSEGAEDLWSQFREAYEAGEIDEDEYQRVRATLAKKTEDPRIVAVPRRTGPGAARRPSGPVPAPPPAVPTDPAGGPGPTAGEAAVEPPDARDDHSGRVG